MWRALQVLVFGLSGDEGRRAFASEREEQGRSRNGRAGISVER